MKLYRALIAAIAFCLAPSVAAAQDSTTQRLTLSDAVRIAARQNANVEVARLRADEADARVRVRRADLLPNVSSYIQEAGRTFNTSTLGIEFPTVPGQKPLFDPRGQVEGPINTTDIRGRFQQSLFDAGALARVRAAKASARSSDADADQAAELAASTAAFAYVRTMRAEADLRARQADTTLATELLGIAKSQLQAGTGVGLDVTRARAQLAATKASLIASRNTRDRAQLDLARALSLPADTRLILADSLGANANVGIADEPALVAQAMTRRADLRAEVQRLRAAQTSISAVRAERLPTLGLVADDGAIGKVGQRLLNTYTWGLQLTVPLFDGYRREGRIQEQSAIAAESQARLRDLELQVSADVHGALLDLSGAREQVDAARERLTLAEQELSQARERFNAGVAGNADVVNASLALTTSRSLVIDAETSYDLARVALARATGAATALR
ncbi:MAG: TolC family protein [Gemmatimonadaceae bacterium]|nr:TolC family protein [Gemmatimonadaceae bacterium]MBA3644649.1 TolC family protein [Gemmatimonadaceae bacterium]